MRYTIPGWDAAHYRRVKSGDTMTRAERWRITLMGDRLRGIRNGADRPVSVHRERVRFGAWEERPTSVAWKLDLMPYLEEMRAMSRAYADAFLSLGRWPNVAPEPPAPVPAEGPSISGPENAYKCAHCGLDLRPFETAWIRDAPVCHPHEGRDCYRRVTVFGEILGSMKDREGL